VGVSLDISNAFNSLPWNRIGRALEYHGVPPYLRRILRTICRTDDSNTGTKTRSLSRDVYREVPQGSVLGSHLSNFEYNAVLNGVLLPPGCDVVCYADDTIILAAGRDWGEARSQRSHGVCCAPHRKPRFESGLGLKVAPQKTEAIYFYKGRRGAPQNDTVMVSGVPVPIGPNSNIWTSH